MTLIWKDTKFGADAVSGTLIIGFVGDREDGSVYWRITAVSMKYIGETSGETETLEEARQALENNWGIWLDRAALNPDTAPTHENPEPFTEEQRETLLGKANVADKKFREFKDAQSPALAPKLDGDA